jgi:hypothetical protein
MKSKIIFIVMLIFTTAKITYCQGFLDSFVVNPKIGTYYTSSSGGFVGGFELNTAYKGVIYSVDFHSFQEFILFTNPNEYYRQIGVMAGKRFGQKLFRIQVQGGLATFWGLRRVGLATSGWLSNSYKSEKFLIPGFVGKVGFKFIPSRVFSIGIDLQTNLNTHNSLLMPMLSLEFGNLRPERKKG